MCKIGFVILHYLSLEDTNECVQSIMNNITFKNRNIVIVDNNSPNNSGQQLEKIYSNIEQVVVIKNRKNLGFSKGNNIGITYARQKMGCDFVVVLNNDTFLMKNDFENILLQEYAESKFSVLGPKIFDPDGYNASNPGSTKIPSIQECNQGIVIWIKELIRACIKSSCKSKVLIQENRKNNVLEAKRSNHRLEGCRLHGCCLIFSPIYFQYFDGFIERTFMYAEESILLINLKKYNLKSVYNPQLKIYHKEAVVSKQTLGSNKSIKKCQLMLKASIALRKEAKLYWKEKDNDK